VTEVRKIDEKDNFCIIAEGDPRYAEVCDVTARHYEKRLGTVLTSFFPEILTKIVDGKITAVCGIRSADQAALFLEQYLDSPVEKYLKGVHRSKIVELGGFSAENRLEAFLLMRKAAVQLDKMGYRYVVCTANRPIQICLAKLGITSQELIAADSSRLDDPHDDWGDYYETSPMVTAGEIAAGVEAITGQF